MNVLNSSLLYAYNAIVPELMLIALGLISLVFAVSPLKNSRVSVGALLWGQVVVLFFSFFWFLVEPSTWNAPILGGMLFPNTGHDMARIALQLVGVVVAWMLRRTSQLGAKVAVECYGLLLAATVALMFLVQSSNFISLFVSLEAASLFITLLIASVRGAGTVSALRYLIQSGLSAVIMLWGMALIYAQTGSMDYHTIAIKLWASQSLWALTGVGLVLAGVAFKLGLFPFTYWLPEVYAGASLPMLGFLATASKFAGVVVLLDLLSDPFYGVWHAYSMVLIGVTMATLIWSALSAMQQTDVKRLLALSGSVHAAFITAGVIMGTLYGPALHVIFFYLLAYIAAVLLILYSLVELDAKDLRFESLKNAYASHPGFSMLIALGFASLAGLPPLSGFIAKFLLFFNAVNLHQWGLLAAMLFASVVGIYYYMSVIFALVGRNNDMNVNIPRLDLRDLPTSTRVITGFLLVIILGLGLVQGTMSLLWK